jgi:hypothetical protein
MSNYFGEPWESGICEDGTQHDAPVGKKCFFCDEVIVEGDRGSFIWANPAIAECMDPDHIVYIFAQHPFDESRGFVSIGANPVHRECSMREYQGGIGHWEDHERWCIGEHDPDGGRTKRQSALEVWELITSHGSLSSPATNGKVDHP